MADMVLDYKGLKCPQPTLKLTLEVGNIPEGFTVEVMADCSKFPIDIKNWCNRTEKTLLSCVDIGEGDFKAEIQF